MFFDGDDDDNGGSNGDQPVTGETGKDNLGDDIGERVGAGHDPVEEDVQ